MKSFAHKRWSVVAALVMVGVLLTSGLALATGLDDYKSARQALKQKQWDEAVRLYKQALDSGDLSTRQRSTAYNNMAVCRAAKGDRVGATAYYTKAIQEFPGNARAYTNRGLSYGKMGDYQAALADHQKAMKLREKALKAKQARQQAEPR